MPSKRGITTPANRGDSSNPSGSSSSAVIALAVTLAIIAYVDRVCISQAAPEISRALGLNDVQMGYAFAAFAWAYGLFEIPAGWLADAVGPRRVLTGIVLVWSVCTAATGWTWNLATLFAARFAFGAAQAGCFPSLTKVFTTWLPKHERTPAQGIMWMSARWGGAFTPILVVWVLTLMPWRFAFLVFGFFGVVWASIFFRLYRDGPTEIYVTNGPGIASETSEEKRPPTPHRVPWRKLLVNRNVQLLWTQYFCLTYGWFFYITWLPKYLQEARHTSTSQSAWLAGLPLFLGGLGSLFSGFISARLVQRLGSVARMRRSLALIGFFGAGGLLLLSIQIENPTAAMFAMGLASFANDLTMPGSWSSCMDVGGRFVGTLSGGMNMMASFAGGLSPMVTGYILEYGHHNWTATFWLSGLVYFVGGLCWLFIDPVTPLESEEK